MGQAAAETIKPLPDRHQLFSKLTRTAKSGAVQICNDPIIDERRIYQGASTSRAVASSRIQVRHGSSHITLRMAVRGLATDNDDIELDDEDDFVVPACIARLFDDTRTQLNIKPSPTGTWQPSIFDIPSSFSRPLRCFLGSSTLQLILRSPPGLPQAATRPPRHLPCAVRHIVSSAEGRLSEGRSHAAEEAQLRRA